MSLFKVKYIIILTSLLFIIGCSGFQEDNTNDNNPNPIQVPVEIELEHKDITVTVFWVGEEESTDNGYIHNIASAWDSTWMESFGGEDTPYDRNGYNPAGFRPNENPFYYALPYNDLYWSGKQKEDRDSDVPWATDKDDSRETICKNRWIKIAKNNKIAYAQWEDVGPFESDDVDYVFGSDEPLNNELAGAGLDVSPAVRDYLELNDVDSVSWEFIDEEDVPSGPWKDIITTTNVNWSK